QPRDSGPSPQSIPNGYPNGAPYPVMAGHRMVAQMNVYKDDQMMRKMSNLGNGQPAIFHVNGSHVLNSTNTIGSTGSRNGSIRVVALYEYESRVDGDISFKKDDIMILLDERLVFPFLAII